MAVDTGDLVRLAEEVESVRVSPWGDYGIGVFRVWRRRAVIRRMWHRAVEESVLEAGSVEGDNVRSVVEGEG